MKAIKLLAAAALLAVAAPANAQFVNTKNDTNKRSSMNSSYEKSSHNAFEIGVGSFYGEAGFSLKYRYTKDYSEYFGVDFFNLSYSAPFSEPSPADMGEISLKIGARGYTPTFGKNMRAYANLDLGYDMTYAYNGWSDETDMYHGFGLEFGLGIYLTKSIALGYALNYNSEIGGTLGHYGRVTFEF